jgi:hypothetical protein
MKQPKKAYGRPVGLLFKRQYGVASRSQLRNAGVSASVEGSRVAAGEWERATKQVVRLAGSPSGPEQELMTALLEAGPSSIASHQSAAWLWGLTPLPERHAVMVGRNVSTRRGPFTLHRATAPETTISIHRGIPTTNPLRTLVDLAGVVASDVVDGAVDRAIARKLVTVEGIRAELDRVGKRGRKGAGAMRAALSRRGLKEGPHPSVLEARFHRLLRAGGIVPVSVEVIDGPNGEYRIDCLLDPNVAVEVDGHIHHSTPEQKAYDERRRADIRMEGKFLLVYVWRDIHLDGRRVLAECRQALARYGAGPQRTRNQAN